MHRDEVSRTDRCSASAPPIDVIFRMLLEHEALPPIDVVCRDAPIGQPRGVG